MDRDTFIITVYSLVVEHDRAHAALYPIRHGGFAPEVSDEEVITMEICGEYLKHQTDQDLFDYFHAHYRHFFPKRPASCRPGRLARDGREHASANRWGLPPPPGPSGSSNGGRAGTARWGPWPVPGGAGGGAACGRRWRRARGRPGS